MVNWKVPLGVVKLETSFWEDGCFNEEPMTGSLILNKLL